MQEQIPRLRRDGQWTASGMVRSGMSTFLQDAKFLVAAPIYDCALVRHAWIHSPKLVDLSVGVARLDDRKTAVT